jgi:uncharacterized peroxidase-related enzyme
MTFIATVPIDLAGGDVRTMYAESQAKLGYIPNYTKVFSHRPHVNAAWGNLLGSIRSTVDPRRYELVTLAAARTLHSSYCMLAHGSILSRDFFSPEQLSQIATDYTSADLTPAEIAMMAYVEKLVEDASSIEAADIQVLRDHGFTDPEIFDIAAVAAARCFFSTLIDALGAEPDASYLGLEEQLRLGLTVGRSISTLPTEQLSTKGQAI